MTLLPPGLTASPKRDVFSCSRKILPLKRLYCYQMSKPKYQGRVLQPAAETRPNPAVREFYLVVRRKVQLCSEYLLLPYFQLASLAKCSKFSPNHY